MINICPEKDKNMIQIYHRNLSQPKYYYGIDVLRISTKKYLENAHTFLAFWLTILSIFRPTAGHVTVV